jgi:hypothetical protein
MSKIIRIHTFFGIVIILFSGMIGISCDDIFRLPEPETPEINKFGSATINSVDLFWSKYNDESFDRYEIYYGLQYTSEYDLYTIIKNKNQAYLTISGLKPKTTYQFYVRAINQEGKYADSKIVSLSTLSDIPSDVSFNNITDDHLSYHSITLSWSEYKDDFAVDFSRYEVYYSTSPSFPDNYLTNKVIVKYRQPIVVISDLTELTDYYFKVRTYNTVEKFSQSDVIHLMTAPCPPDIVYLYEPPDSLVTESSVKVNWSRSIDTGFIRYEVHMDTYPTFIPDSTTFITSFNSKDETECKINNLTKNEEYFIKIVVIKNNNSYSISNYVGITATTGGYPIPVEIYDPIDANLSSRSINVEWSKSVTRFLYATTVFMSLTHGFAPESRYTIASDTSSSFTHFKINYLMSNTTYYFIVRIQNKMSKNADSKEKTIKTR